MMPRSGPGLARSYGRQHIAEQCAKGSLREGEFVSAYAKLWGHRVPLP